MSVKRQNQPTETPSEKKRRKKKKYSMRKAENDRAKNKLLIIIYYSCYPSRLGFPLAGHPAKYDYIRGDGTQ